MKHLGQLIKNHIETNKLSKKQVAESAGISPTYLSSLFKKETMECSLYERICCAIGMNPAIAFETAGDGTQILSNINAKTLVGPASVTIGETQMLKDLLAEKERLIQVLMATAGLKIGTHTEQ